MISSVLGVFLGFAQSIFLVKTTVIRCNLEFDRYARLSLLRGFITFILYICVLSIFNSFTIFVVIDIAVTLALVRNTKLPIPLKWSTKAFWKFNMISHLRKNRNLIFFVLSTFLLISYERILGYIFLNDYEYAVIAFAGIFFSVSANIQSIANSYIFPMMAVTLSENGQRALVNQGVFYTVITLLILGLIGSLVVAFSADLVINFFENIPLTISIIWGIAILSVLRISDFLTNIFLLLHKENTIIRIRIFVLIFGLIYILFYRAVTDLIFIASLSTFLIYILMLIILIKQMRSHTIEINR